MPDRSSAAGGIGQPAGTENRQTGDNISVGDIKHAAGVAIGAGASAQVFKGGTHLHYETPSGSIQGLPQAQMALDPDILRSLLSLAQLQPEQPLPRRQLDRWPDAVESYRRAVERGPSRYMDWLVLAASARMARDDALWR